MPETSRREFLKWTSTVPIAAAVAGRIGLAAEKDAAASNGETASNMQLGLVTYNWGRGWDLPTVIKNCEQTGFAGVELRSTHKHGVEISIDSDRRKEVAKRFADVRHSAMEP